MRAMVLVVGYRLLLAWLHEGQPPDEVPAACSAPGV
jgi:hypothetical protein